MGLTNPSRTLGQFSVILISPKIFTLSGIPPFSTNSFRLASLLTLLVGLNLSFLIGALAWFMKITKAVSFESVEVFHKDSLLALFYSLFSLMIFLLLCLPFYADNLAIWFSSLMVPSVVEATQGSLFRLER